ncbi:hypothetical protein SAMN05518683_105100 [Salibacterium halotolerans]|uniref:Uncharacterized protein n=1 Tax=Salibacterium halotolerans TaxID=1884432 RepID=A0A1I5QCB6_9BACI|nr:hypothetical protein SAMN05518683_105100 [Salibacterium halotolerans]
MDHNEKLNIFSLYIIIMHHPLRDLDIKNEGKAQRNRLQGFEFLLYNLPKCQKNDMLLYITFLKRESGHWSASFERGGEGNDTALYLTESRTV